jgi:hypothetical protein
MKTLLSLLIALSFVIPAFANPEEFPYEKETLDGLHVGDSAKKLVEKHGQPDKKSEENKWEADGLYHQEWTYTKAGLVYRVAGEKKGGDKDIYTMEVVEPGKAATGKGIKIGSAKAEVTKAYGKFINKEESSEHVLVAGTIYGGAMFRLANGKVESIFIGAAAE